MAKATKVENTFQFFNEIGIINQLASNAFEAQLPLGLTSSQFTVLNWFVRVDVEATPGRLATAFMVTKGAMTNTLKRLEEKGYVSVEIDSTNGRRKIVKMTEEGAAARLAALEAVEPLLREVSDKFKQADFTASLPFLEEMRKFLDERRYS